MNQQAQEHIAIRAYEQLHRMTGDVEVTCRPASGRWSAYVIVRFESAVGVFTRSREVETGDEWQAVFELLVVAWHEAARRFGRLHPVAYAA